MTLKSAARLARDAKKQRNTEQLEKNTCWDDLNSMYAGCSQLLHRHTHLAQFSKDTELITEVVDKTTLVSNIRLLAADLQKMSSELTEISIQHSEQTGGSDDPDVVMKSINIFEQYNLFMERHEAVVMPTVHHILEQFDQAEHALLRKRQALQAELDKMRSSQQTQAELDTLDPSIITDVAFTTRDKE